MPAKAPRKKQSQINSIKSKKILTLKNIIIAILLLVIAGLVFYWSFGGRMSERMQMANYLQDKYGEEFVVDAPIRKASGLGVEGYLQANAYPKKSSDLRFSIQMSSSGITDRYPSAVWQYDQDDIVRQLVKETLPFQVVNTKVSIVPDGSVVFRGSVPDYQEVRKKSANNISYSIGIDILVEDTQAFEIRKWQIQSNLKTIADFLITQDIKTPSIIIAINIKSDNSRYVCTMYDQKNIEVYMNDINGCFRQVE